MKYYSLEKVLRIIAESGYSIEWEAPYEIEKFPEDLYKLSTLESTVAKYWIRDPGKKDLKLTQVSKGLITELYLTRTLLISVKLTSEKFEEAIVEPDTNF
ncbi:hypothetical protein JWG44_05475 [Leptospira sp. 201903071]|uniref:hypothetical protein n=1 Tax=Leptospira ainazelensis TaxID=2810034 RepID=UPI001963D663|nr:hypothetical protein [Leptospira ainazelensis]MBM9499700.1 hypothetical protein [Leptospira ainazelensis]